MVTPHWQLSTPISAIVFDCDGTLSAIEGIDELAEQNGVGDEVKQLTQQAMGKTSITPALFQKRLDLVRPQQQQLEQLSQHYFSHRVPDVETVIHIFQKLHKSIYIISAGMNPAVHLFGKALQIPDEHVYAVNLLFNHEGQYLDFDRTSPLITPHGKKVIVETLKLKHPHLIHIGDGITDYETHDLVTRFIGYGGIFYRKNIETLCQYYIRTPSLAPLLPLALTQKEYEQLSKTDQLLYEKGMEAIHHHQIKYE